MHTNISLCELNGKKLPKSGSLKAVFSSTHGENEVLQLTMSYIVYKIRK